MGSQRLPGASPRRNMHWGHASPEAKQEPEDVLIAWLLWLPRDVDVAKAAADEVARIDKRPSLPGGAARLRELLLQLVDSRSITQYGTA
jgi:hypothetical protein